MHPGAQSSNSRVRMVWFVWDAVSLNETRLLSISAAVCPSSDSLDSQNAVSAKKCSGAKIWRTGNGCGLNALNTTLQTMTSPCHGPSSPRCRGMVGVRRRARRSRWQTPAMASASSTHCTNTRPSITGDNGPRDTHVHLRYQQSQQRSWISLRTLVKVNQLRMSSGRC